MHMYFWFCFYAVRNAIDDLGFLDQVIGIKLSNLDQVTGIALRLVRGVERRTSQLSFYLSSKFEIREFCYTYVLLLVPVCCAQCNRRFGFFGSGYRHCIALFGVSRGVCFLTFPSICRLNLKFESSAIHTYYWFFGSSVRNAIDDSGFLDQVIGIELSNLGHCFHLMGHLRWPKEKRDRERGKETREREKETKKEKEQEVRGNRVKLGQKDRLTLIWSLVDRT